MNSIDARAKISSSLNKSVLTHNATESLKENISNSVLNKAPTIAATEKSSKKHVNFTFDDTPMQDGKYKMLEFSTEAKKNQEMHRTRNSNEIPNNNSNCKYCSHCSAQSPAIKYKLSKVKSNTEKIAEDSYEFLKQCLAKGDFKKGKGLTFGEYSGEHTSQPIVELIESYVDGRIKKDEIIGANECKSIPKEGIAQDFYDSLKEHVKCLDKTSVSYFHSISEHSSIKMIRVRL